MNRDQALFALGNRSKAKSLLGAKTLLEHALRGSSPVAQCAIDWTVEVASNDCIRIAIPSLRLTSDILPSDLIENAMSERLLALVAYKHLFPQIFTDESVALARDREGKDLGRPFSRMQKLSTSTVSTSISARLLDQVIKFNDIAIVGLSSAGKSVAARQVVENLLRDGWSATWLNFSSANPAPEELLNSLSVTPIGAKHRHVVIADDVQASPAEFRRVVSLCSLLRTSDQMAITLIVIGWNSVRDLISSLLPSAIIVNINGDEVLRDLIDHKLDQAPDDIALTILRQSKGNVLLGSLAIELSAQTGAAPQYDDLINVAWEHSNAPSDLNTGHIQILYALACLTIFETEVRRLYLDSISPAGVISLLKAGAVRTNNEFVSLGHIEFAKLIHEKLKRDFSTLIELEEPSAVAVRYLRASDRIQIIKTLDRLDLARLADGSDDMRGGAFLARAWSSIGLLAKRVRKQNDKDPTWGDNMASCIFASLSLEAIGDDSWRQNYEIICKRWSVSDDDQLPSPAGSMTAERLDFDEIKKRMAAEDLQPVQEFRGYSKASGIDLDPWHRTWVTSLLLWYESQIPTRDSNRIRTLVRSLTMVCSPDGWFEPARVPWQTARCLLALTSAGLSVSTDEVLRRACQWMRRSPPEGPCRFGVWDSGTGDWNSTAMTTSMSILALLRAGVPASDRSVESAASYLLSTKHEWARPGCELDCVLVVQALLAAKGGWRSCSTELEGLLRWSNDPKVWDFATRPASEAQQESSKAAFIALELITIVWEVVRAELPLLLQNIVVTERAEAGNQKGTNDQLKNVLRKALKDLQEHVSIGIRERQVLLSQIGTDSERQPQPINEMLNAMRKDHAALSDIETRLATATFAEDIQTLVNKVNEIGKRRLRARLVRRKMRTRLTEFSPGFVYFMSGVFASAGINLLTGIPACTGGLRQVIWLLVASVPWLLASWQIAVIAQTLDAVQQKVAELRTPTLTANEVFAIRDQEFSQVRGRVRNRFVTAIVCLLAAIAAFLGASDLRTRSVITPAPGNSLVTPSAMPSSTP